MKVVENFILHTTSYFSGHDLIVEVPDGSFWNIILVNEISYVEFENSFSTPDQIDQAALIYIVFIKMFV